MAGDDHAVRRARHQPKHVLNDERGRTWCQECLWAWPCDAAVLGAALEEAKDELHDAQMAVGIAGGIERGVRAALRDAQTVLDQERRARQAAEQRIAALEGALGRIDAIWPKTHGPGAHADCPWCIARQALAGE